MRIPAGLCLSDDREVSLKEVLLMKGLMIDLKELHGEVNAPYVETKNSDMNGKTRNLTMMLLLHAYVVD